MKKFISFVLMLILIPMLCACPGPFSYKKTPRDYINTRWISEDPYICLEVYSVPFYGEDDIYISSYNEVKGEMILDGELIYIEAQFGRYGRGVNFYNIANPIYDEYGNELSFFGGYIKCSKKKMKLTIDKEINSVEIFGKEVKKITFIREDLTPEEASEYSNN